MSSSKHGRTDPLDAVTLPGRHGEAALVVPLLTRSDGPVAEPQVVGAPPLRGLLDALPDGLVIADADGGIVYANRRFAELSGYDVAELRGQRIEMLVPERMRELHERHRSRYTSSPTVRPMGAGLNIRLRRKDGSEFAADISLSPLATDGSRVTLAMIRDVTDRREAEERLRRSEERFRLLVEWVQDYAILMLEPDGRLASWNLGAQRITGYDAEEIIGRNVAVLYPPEEAARGRPQKQLERARREGRVTDEGWRLRKDGTRFWASVALTALPDDGGGVRGFAKVIRDMTERRYSAARLEAVAEITRAVLENRTHDQVLQVVARRGRELVGAATAAVATPSGPGELMVRVGEGDAGTALVGTTVAATGTVTGEAVRTRAALRLDDALQSDSMLVPSLAEAAGLGPLLVVPLATEERPFGALVVGNLRGQAVFTEEDQRSLELFAAQASVALEHGRIRGELERLAIIEDRERIARELHDGIVQALFAVGLGLLSVEPLASEPPVRERIHEAVDSIDRAIADLRRYIFGLKPQAVAEESLASAITHLVRDFEARTRVVTAVDVDARIAGLGDEVAGEVVQMTREALSNVARHAHATTCRVSLRYEAPHAVLEIDDDGRGFDPSSVPGHGYGLTNLQERAARIGGSLEITSQAGQGTTMRLRFPVGT